jgi:tetratricopeptide (TPR) repeat protein
VLGALGIELRSRGESLPGLLRKLGLTSLLALLVGGWHYARVWKATGHLVIGGWDPSVGLAWWQEPGFRTMEFFTRCGGVLARPLFSGTRSFIDGLYATLWGDSLCAGAADLARRPPWNYDLMGIGYLLALVPSALILIGLLDTGWKLARHGGSQRFLLVSLTAAVSLGLIYLNLTVPCHATVKAFYGLVALVPLCFFGVTGWERITRGGLRRQWALGAILIVSAATNFGAVWIQGRKAPAYICRGLASYSEGSREIAAEEFARAVNAAPDNALAQRLLARSLSEQGQRAEALQHAELAVRLKPGQASGHLQLGMILAKQGEKESAIGHARSALQLDPDYAIAYQSLSTWLQELGRSPEAADIAREGLAVSPTLPELHLALGLALVDRGNLLEASNHFLVALSLRPDWTTAHFQLGLLAFKAGDFQPAASHFKACLDQFPWDSRAHRLLGAALLKLHEAAPALQHLEEAVRLAPHSPETLNELAWVLATHSSATLRDGPRALQLAQKACAESGSTKPKMLATLAAAYAEAGQFAEATKTAREALAQAQTGAEAELAGSLQSALLLYESGRPYHQPP